MSTRQKHTVVEVRELANAEYPEVIIVMSSGREWWFRRTLCRANLHTTAKVRKDHMMHCKDLSTRPTVDHAAEYKVAKEAARSALNGLEAKKREAGTLKLEVG